MRFLIPIFCCCAALGYSEESLPPAEITTADEGESEDVAVNVDSKKSDKPTSGGCGCGKPKA